MRAVEALRWMVAAAPGPRGDADMIVDTDGRSVSATADEIEVLLERARIVT